MHSDIIGYVLVAIIGIGSFVVFIVSLFYLWKAFSLFGVLVESGTNDGNLAIKKFLEVVEQAEQVLVIYDDGDQVADTIYNKDEVSSALTSRMKQAPRLRVRVLFNKKSDIELPKRMSQFGDRFEVRYRTGERPAQDVHFKIADGRVGYFSQHGLGDTDREFTFCDARHTSKKARKRAFGAHLQYFNEQFQDQAAA